MKKSILLVAAAIGMLTTSCNKDLENLTQTPITISATYDGEGEKVAYTEDGANITATWEAGDELIVCWNNHKNTLTLSSGAGTSSATFTGTITGTPSANSTLVCFVKDSKNPGAVTISDNGDYLYTSDAFLTQDGSMDSAASRNLYYGTCFYGDGTNISCTFSVNTAMMKFTVSIPANDVGRNATLIYKSGNTEISKASFIVDETPKTIYLSIPAGSYSGNQSVVYNCTSSSTTKTEILSDHANFVAGQTYSRDITFIPKGALSGQFTINANGDKVLFSKGNLQATTTDLGEHWSWSFAENQYDYIGNTSANITINGNGTVSANGTVDLFGWSTAATYYGINNSDQNIYSGSFIDWGTNAITNGGNVSNIWRTLTEDELYYLLKTRATGVTLNYVSDARFAWGTVEGTAGVIIIPDGFVNPRNINWSCVNQEYKPSDPRSYSSNEWQLIEAAGAVFLPCAGNRLGVSIRNINGNTHYWTATSDSDEAINAYNLNAGMPNDRTTRCFGMSVRLVFDIE
jgi:hypothetical protein